MRSKTGKPSKENKVYIKCEHCKKDIIGTPYRSTASKKPFCNYADCFKIGWLKNLVP